MSRSGFTVISAVRHSRGTVAKQLKQLKQLVHGTGCLVKGEPRLV